jgi:hypothetical protein
MRKHNATSFNFADSKTYSITKEFEQSPIKDKRLLARLKQTAESFDAKPEKSIPEACGNWSKTKSVYRFLGNHRIHHESLLEGHRQQTLRRCEPHSVVLAIQDTSSLNLSHPHTEGLGPTTTAKNSLGLLIHSTMAVAPSGVMLGLLDQQIWARDPKSRGKRHQRYDLPIQEKESYKWLSALERSTKGISETAHVVTICDREADIYEFFQRALEMKQDILVRARHDRRIVEEEMRFYARLSNLPVSGECLVEVPRNSSLNTPPRKARLALRFGSVTICPSTKCKGTNLPDIPLHAVLAKEISAPEGVEPLEWCLLTTLSVNNIQEALEKVDWYRHRWKIERFHFVLKSGCQVEELQLETAQALKNAVTIYSVVAWKLSWLMGQSRETPNEPCTLIFEDYEWKILYFTVNQTTELPIKPPSLEEAVLMVARLGGFLARKNDGKPGVKVLWRGFQRLNDILKAYQFLKSAPL